MCLRYIRKLKVMQSYFSEWIAGFISWGRDCKYRRGLRNQLRAAISFFQPAMIRAASAL
ncbi:hypothetical protein C7408_107209 [Paraburkholderia caballeronis]|nr:hypothetical protein C7408_107209 [Paraburkholderia caballeronis]TDV16778.1 hypothetical protein C7406_10739 [Paraburkholderia caballeronis]TDV25833.1 hypothetical protein C7404_107209 [Paraburkholderia caballeronis]